MEPWEKWVPSINMSYESSLMRRHQEVAYPEVLVEDSRWSLTGILPEDQQVRGLLDSVMLRKSKGRRVEAKNGVSDTIFPIWKTRLGLR